MFFVLEHAMLRAVARLALVSYLVVSCTGIVSYCIVLYCIVCPSRVRYVFLGLASWGALSLSPGALIAATYVLSAVPLFLLSFFCLSSVPRGCGCPRVSCCDMPPTLVALRREQTSAKNWDPPNRRRPKRTNAADERQADESRRKTETEALRAKLTRVERKNTEVS